MPKTVKEMQEIIDKKLKVNFNQGLDLRLINDEKVQLQSKVKYYTWKFDRRSLHFAWDNIKDEKVILKGLETVLKYIPRLHVMVYVLVGFDSTLDQDLYRLNKLIELHVKPFVMVYNNKRDPILRHLARWINKNFYEVCTWREYCKKKGVNTINS